LTSALGTAIFVTFFCFLSAPSMVQNIAFSRGCAFLTNDEITVVVTVGIILLRLPRRYEKSSASEL